MQLRRITREPVGTGLEPRTHRNLRRVTRRRCRHRRKPTNQLPKEREARLPPPPPRRRGLAASRPEFPACRPCPGCRGRGSAGRYFRPQRLRRARPAEPRAGDPPALPGPCSRSVGQPGACAVGAALLPAKWAGMLRAGRAPRAAAGRLARSLGAGQLPQPRVRVHPAPRTCRGRASLFSPWLVPAARGRKARVRPVQGRADGMNT